MRVLHTDCETFRESVAMAAYLGYQVKNKNKIIFPAKYEL
jgi:hypothetical protein